MKAFSVSYNHRSKCLIFSVRKEISVDEILNDFYIGRKQRYFYYHNRLIQRNHKVITQSCQCRQNDIVTISTTSQKTEQIVAWEQPLQVCYEDDICLIVNKPSGLLVHSDGTNQAHTLHNIVQAYYIKHQIDAPVRAVHRLDMDTSGLLFYCKMPFFQAYFDALLKTKQISRIYLAWVNGIIEKPITIQKAIARDRHHANKMRISNTGADAETAVLPLAHHHQCTLVECRLKTGRTHQIRVHLASVKHPLLSDPLYGSSHPKAKRLALHAWKLQFYHPLLNQTICVRCPLPDDMPYLQISEAALCNYESSKIA